MVASPQNTFHGQVIFTDKLFPPKGETLTLPGFPSLSLGSCFLQVIPPRFSFPFNLPNGPWTQHNLYLCFSLNRQLSVHISDNFFDIIGLNALWIRFSPLNLSISRVPLYLSMSAPMSSSHLTTEGSSATQLMCNTFSP